MQEHGGFFSRIGSEPLAARMRPRTLSEYFGQEDILGQGKLLRRAIEADQLSSLLLWGPPGSGKTTLGHVIANRTKGQFLTINAVLAGVKDIRSAIASAQDYWQMYKSRSILFVDEVHRFNKAQQDALLPHVENGMIILIGATTENPYFEVIKPLVSRSRVFALRALTPQEIEQVLQQALDDKERGYGSRKITITPDALAHLSDVAQGDARSALNALELAVETTEPDENSVIAIDREVAEESIQRRALLYDKDGDVHYDTISAFIKSLRGSDPDAALYWMARMLYSGEDPRFIARRMVIFASEDVGMADPLALQVATAAAHAVEYVGMPECQFNLSQACIHLATAEKSNSTMAYFDALKKVEAQGIDEVPNHLKDSHRDRKGLGHGKGYKYPHAHREHWVPQQYLPDKLEGSYFYHATDQGFEATVRERMARLRRKKAGGESPVDGLAAQVRRKWEPWQKKLHGDAIIKQRDLVLRQMKLTQDSAILDLGPNALFGWALLGEVPLGRAVCMFSDPASLREFNRNRRQWRVDRILQGIMGSIDPLPFQSARFQVVYCRYPFARAHHPRLLARETARVLADGGRFCFVEALPARRKRLWQEIDLRSLPPELVDKVIGAEESLYTSEDGIFGLDEEKLNQKLGEGGFEVKSLDLRQEEERIPVTEAFIEALFTNSRSEAALSYGERLRRVLSEEELALVKGIVEQQLNGRMLNRQAVHAYVVAVCR